MNKNVECYHLGEVHYDVEADNYYCADCAKGMGVQYYRLAKEFRIIAWERDVALECMKMYQNWYKEYERKYLVLLNEIKRKQYEG